MLLCMNADEFQELAESAYAALPVHFVQAIENVVILTDSFPDAATIQQMKRHLPTTC